MSSAKCLASGNMPSSKSRGVLCKVCGDEASGFHYGVDSCEGCKGFFRRCLTQGMNHKCAVDERCEITPFSRNSCQFCRLKKCFQVGMSREASRLGRRPKRLKEMNQSNSEPPHPHPHHRNDKKSFPNITNLFPFTFPFPQIALNMSDLQTFMRNLNTPMGLIASHQTTILPPPPPPSLLSSFYHLENVNMSFFPSSNVSFSTPNYSNASEISSAEHKKIGKSETIENVTILENNLSLCVPDLNPLFKGPSFMAPNTVGQSLAFASPSLKCYINNNNNNNNNNNGRQNASPVFLNEFDGSAQKRNEKISSPQVFSPIIVAGGGANKRFKSNSAGFFPKSYDRHKQNEHFHPNNSHPPKISSSFTVDFLKCSSNLEESKDSPMENENSLFTNSNFNLEPLMTGFTRTPFRRNLSSPTQQSESNFLKFPINHLAKHPTHSSNHLRRMPSNMTTHPYLMDRKLSDQKHDNNDHNRSESKESCNNGSELKDPLGFINKSGQMFLKRQAPSEFFGSTNGSSDPINAMPMILSIGDSEISFNNQEDYNFIGNNITFNQPNALSSTEFSADKKSLLELPSGKEDEENRNYPRDENDSVISVDDKDQFDETSFCELEFQTGGENGAAEEQDGDSGLQEHSTIVQDKLARGDGKINEDEWTSLSADMKKQIFLARNSDISQDRNDLINLVESSLISAHMQTCIYTSARVKDGITKFKESNINLCDGLIDLQMSDPIKWWEQFVNNMVPVIKRIVMFSKKLPGFSELNQDDQIVLIKQGSFEVILTRYTQLISEDGMFLPDMSVMVPREKFVHMPLGDFFEEQCKFANDFNKLKLDDYETGILSGIMVMNPERDGLENVRAVQKLQVLYMQALYTYMKRHRSDNYDEHFVKTICSLPKLSRINDLHSKKMQCMKMLCSNGVKMPDLHKEMFHY